jgi:hypothetical protein
MPDKADKPSASVPFDDIRDVEFAKLKRRRGERSSPLPVPEGDMRPTGLALSGGGIRSAAVCLGAIQALRSHSRLDSVDYLSTVSGGGYTGACLSAAMSKKGGGTFPFEIDSGDSADQFKDSPVVAHIRNYSNYLLPRSRSAIRNWTEAAVIILRGLLANAVCVIAFLLPAAWLTAVAFPHRDLLEANFIPYLFGWQPAWRFLIPTGLAGLLALLLTIWAMARSRSNWDRITDDTSSGFLSITHVLLALLLLAFALDLQPLAIGWIGSKHVSETWVVLKASLPALTAFMGAVSALASSLGKFLHTSRRSQSLVTMGLRLATQAALIVAAVVLPLLIWVGYIELSLWVIPNQPVAMPWDATAFPAIPLPRDWTWLPETRLGLIVRLTVVSWAIMLCLRANGYSLHRLYRDRLSKAFLVSALPELDVRANGKTRSMETWKLKRLRNKARAEDDCPPLDTIRLSELQSSTGPYPLINAALNVQGSLEANRRGRNADFFVFTPDYVGSDLTEYAPVKRMEALDSRLDVATAMAISGAAASANMGGNTVRILSPTLSLLNIRLGYYLANPRYVGAKPSLLRWWHETLDRFYLFIEMFNGLTEERETVYLTDGGHIENLGIYSLLKRKCGFILAIDSEADPELSCESLLQMERYARIDLGIRIVLPWEQIAQHSCAVSDTLPDGPAPCDAGPHCAIGWILYPDGSRGLLVYVKSSLSGDEKDYILDYAKRNPAFPHETTGDQFFSEEQFEMYRGLGFHMMDGLFGKDRVAYVHGHNGFADEAEARAALDAALPPAATQARAPAESRANRR